MLILFFCHLKYAYYDLNDIDEANEFKIKITNYYYLLMLKRR